MRVVGAQPIEEGLIAGLLVEKLLKIRLNQGVDPLLTSLLYPLQRSLLAKSNESGFRVSHRLLCRPYSLSYPNALRDNRFARVTRRSP